MLAAKPIEPVAVGKCNKQGDKKRTDTQSHLPQTTMPYFKNKRDTKKAKSNDVVQPL